MSITVQTLVGSVGQFLSAWIQMMKAYVSWKGMNELDSNLAVLRLIEAEKKKSEWSGVFRAKGDMGWKAAEKNRALGYNGLSDRTCRWREKEAHDRAIS